MYTPILMTCLLGLGIASAQSSENVLAANKLVNVKNKPAGAPLLSIPLIYNEVAAVIQFADHITAFRFGPVTADNSAQILNSLIDQACHQKSPANSDNPAHTQIGLYHPVKSTPFDQLLVDYGNASIDEDETTGENTSISDLIPKWQYSLGAVLQNCLGEQSVLNIETLNFTSSGVSARNTVTKYNVTVDYLGHLSQQYSGLSSLQVPA